MTSKDFLECIEIVDNINEELDNILEFYVPSIAYLKVWYEGYEYGVEFLGKVIWSTTNDEREYIEEKDDYEPLEHFLKNKMSNILEQLGKIKFNDNK